MRRGLASRAAVLGALAGIGSTAACSLLFSVRDWDSQYGADAGGGSRGADDGGRGGLGGSAGSDAGSDGAACSCLGTCTNGRCDKALLVTAPGGATVQAIACSTNGYIYYVLSGGPDVLQVPSSGHAPACSCGAVGGQLPFDVAVGDGTVAWISFSPSDMTRHVYTHPDVSCCPSSQGVEVAAVNAGGAVEQFRSGIAVDATNVYWVDTSDAQQASLHPDAGQPIQLLSGEGYFTGIAVAGSNVLVNDANNKKLWAAPIGVAATGNSAPSFGLPDYGGAGIRVFGANAAWAYDHQTKNEVDFMPWEGGTACPVTVGIDNPTGLALDATFVYVKHERRCGHAVAISALVRRRRRGPRDHRSQHRRGVRRLLEPLLDRERRHLQEREDAPEVSPRPSKAGQSGVSLPRADVIDQDLGARSVDGCVRVAHVDAQRLPLSTGTGGTGSGGSPPRISCAPLGKIAPGESVTGTIVVRYVLQDATPSPARRRTRALDGEPGGR